MRCPQRRRGQRDTIRENGLYTASCCEGHVGRESHRDAGTGERMVQDESGEGARD